MTISSQDKSFEHNDIILESGKSFYVYASNTNKCYGCAYCVLSSIDYIKEDKKGFFPTFKNVKIGVLPSKLNKALINIPVAINNAYGDAGIQWDDTINRLNELESSGHKGIVGIITKTGMTKSKAKQLKQFDLNLIVLQSVSRLQGVIEPISYSHRIKGIENLLNEGVQTMLYYRPIIAGFNDSVESIETVIKDTSKVGIKAMVYSGLAGTQEVLKLLESNLKQKIEPPVGYSQWQSDHKLISKGKREEIEQISRQYGIEPFRKTSCGVSYLLGLPADYNLHYTKPIKNGCKDCVKNIDCSSYASMDYKDITKALDFYNTTGKLVENKIEGNCNLDNVCSNSCSSCSISTGSMLHMQGSYTLGEIGIARWLSGVNVTADNIIMSNRILENKINLEMVQYGT